MSIPAVEILGESVLLRRPAVLDVARLVSRAIRHSSSTDGFAPPQRIVFLQQMLEEAARTIEASMAAEGQADVRDLTWLENCEESTTTQLVDSEDAAQALGCSTRQVRRYARVMGARRIGGRWQYERGAVLAFAAERRQEGRSQWQ